MNHIRDNRCIQRGSEILQKLFVIKDTHDTRKEQKCYEDIKNKERENTMRNNEKTQWRSIRWIEEAATFYIK